MNESTIKACFEIIAGAFIGVGKMLQDQGHEGRGVILEDAGESIVQTMKNEIPDSGPPTTDPSGNPIGPDGKHI